MHSKGSIVMKLDSRASGSCEQALTEPRACATRNKDALPASLLLCRGCIVPVCRNRKVHALQQGSPRGQCGAWTFRRQRLDERGLVGDCGRKLRGASLGAAGCPLLLRLRKRQIFWYLA